MKIIDPTLNTASYVYVLLAHITAAQKGGKGFDREKLWDKIESFLESFDNRQIRYLGKEFTHIIDVLVKFANSSHQVSLLLLSARVTR